MAVIRESKSSLRSYSSRCGREYGSNGAWVEPVAGVTVPLVSSGLPPRPENLPQTVLCSGLPCLIRALAAILAYILCERLPPVDDHEDYLWLEAFLEARDMFYEVGNHWAFRK